MWLPRAVVAVTSVGLLAFDVVDPDAFIAERNVARYAETGKIDIAYLGTLSPDAVPALARLPSKLASCAVGPIAARMPDDEDLWSFNAGRARARSLLRDRSELRDGCPR